MNAFPDNAIDGLRVPPHSVEAEHSVLGGLLIDNSAWDRAADLLTDSDFYRHEHKLIYATIGKLVNAGKPADVVTVFEALTSTGKAEDCGGLSYLNALAQTVPRATNLRRYAEIVHERAKLRDLIAKIDEAHALAFGLGEVPEKLDRVAALFAEVDVGNRRRNPKCMDAVVVSVMDAVNEAAEGSAVYWRTGIPALDHALGGGLLPGDLMILAARPSTGKSSFAQQVGTTVASDEHSVLFLSQEMSALQLGRRAVANRSRVSLSHLKTGRLADDEWARLAESVDGLGRLPMWVDDEPALGLRAIRAKARYVKGLRVLIVDYVQLSVGEGETRSAQVGSITRGLKALAKEMGIAVIALSQLNRAVDARTDKRPQMGDLRDSGEIEQDADMIVFLWPLSEDATQEVRPIGCELAKNRDGERCAFALELDAPRQTWRESAQSLASFGPRTRGNGNFE